MTDAFRTSDQHVTPQTDFERFALDHKAHTHCLGCNGCLLDPSHLIQGYPAWCVGCRDRIKAANAPGVPLPWAGQIEFHRAKAVPCNYAECGGSGSIRAHVASGRAPCPACGGTGVRYE